MGAEDYTGEQSFDELAKGLATGAVSRRKALRMLGGALVGGMLASVPGVAWAVKCRPLERKCATNRDCCSRYCDKNGRICACPPETTLCSSQCVRCSNVGEFVNPATCKCECPSGEVVCDGRCVSESCDPTTGEVFNPATCQCECATGATLCGGQCRSCPEGQTLNPTTCQCEGTCPAQSCCCNCFAVNPATGSDELIFCGTNVTSRAQCETICSTVGAGRPGLGVGFGCANGTGVFGCGSQPLGCAPPQSTPTSPNSCGCFFTSC